MTFSPSGQTVLVCFLLTACGGSVTASPSQPIVDSSVAETPARTLAQACSDFAAAACKEFDICRFAPRQQFASAADCMSRINARCVRDATAPGVIDPVDRLDQCSRAMYVQRCEERVRLPAVCEFRPGTFHGALGDGTRCWRHEQCASGACGGSLVPTYAQCGKCARLPMIGDACTSGVGCEVDNHLGTTGTSLVCDSATGRCVRGAAFGETCNAERGCMTPFFCVEGTCRTYEATTKPVGTPCIGDWNCGFERHCDSTALICEQTLVAPLGGACVRNDEVRDTGRSPVCGGGAFCSAAYVCKPTLPLDAKCGVAAGEFWACGWDAVCQRDTNRCGAIDVLCAP